MGFSRAGVLAEAGAILTTMLRPHGNILSEPLEADRRLVANPQSPGWDWILGRRDIPGTVAQVRATGRSMRVGPEEVERVSQWIERVGWEPDEAPMLLAAP